MRDDDSEIPEADEEFFRNAKLRRPPPPDDDDRMLLGIIIAVCLIVVVGIAMVGAALRWEETLPVITDVRRD